MRIPKNETATRLASHCAAGLRREDAIPPATIHWRRMPMRIGMLQRAAFALQ